MKLLDYTGLQYLITKIKTLLANKADKTHTHNYAGSSSAGGSATTALTCTGNSATTTKLATARTIGISGGATGTATSFNGSANITIPVTSLDATKLSGTATISTTGNASSATKLQTARTINGTSFNGTANITTANWGTARNITIGNTTKSVNGSANVSWTKDELGLTYANISPINEKIYTGIYATANDFANSTFYFGNIIPDDYYQQWHIKYIIYAKVPNQNNYTAYCEVELYGALNARTIYKITNAHYNTSYKTLSYHVLYSATQTGITNGYGHAVGIELRNSANPTSSSYPRTFNISLIEQDNCTFSFLNTMTLYSALNGTGSTNYSGYSEFDGSNNGLRESGDDNNYDRMLIQNNRLYAGTNKILPYSLIMEDSTGSYQSLVLSSSTGTTKSINTTGFVLGKIFYYSSSATIASGSQTATYTLYEVLSGVDFRYSSNCGSTLTAYKPVYLVGTITNGLFYLNTKIYSQSLPTTADGLVYMYIGDSYSTTSINLSQIHPLYVYRNGHIQLYFGNAETVNGYTINSNVPANAKFTDTVYSLPTASSTTLGGVKTTSTVTSASGYTACPIVSGVPYYKDTNTTYSLSSFGVTATASELNALDGITSTVTELNYCDGVTSNIQTQLNGKASSSHTHSYLPLSGGTVTGQLTIKSDAMNGAYNGLLVGDDCYIGDCNTAHTIGLMSTSDNNVGYLKFGKAGGTLGYDGSKLVATNNISAPSIYTGNWFRSTGNSGWYSETYGGGWYMTDTTWMKLFNKKSLAVENSVQIYKDGITQPNFGGNNSHLEILSQDGTYPTICLHRSGYSYCLLSNSTNGELLIGKNDGTWNKALTTADTITSSNAIASTGYGISCLTYLQQSDAFDGNTGWCHYLIANHGDGNSYYHYTIGLPFWSAPIYKRQMGNTSSTSGWHKFYTSENITYGTSGLTAGSSTLASGSIYLQYE